MGGEGGIKGKINKKYIKINEHDIFYDPRDHVNKNYHNWFYHLLSRVKEKEAIKTISSIDLIHTFLFNKKCPFSIKWIYLFIWTHPLLVGKREH